MLQRLTHYLTGRGRSFRYAFQGLADLLRSQPNARIHLAAMIGTASLGYYFGLERWEWTILLLCFALVMSAEAFNTALEHLVNLVSPGYHPLAGRAKDAAAAGVLLCALGTAIIGIIIFWPYCKSLI